MKLNKSEVLEWHKLMWISISKEIARNKRVLDIPGLKRKFIECFDMPNIRNNCFCCHYVFQDYSLYNIEEFNCAEYCPIIWGNDINKGCMQAEYKSLIYCKDWKKQVKLTYKIATLPERSIDNLLWILK